MTISDFSRKYKIPHRVVYEASYQARLIEPESAYTEYSESDLLRSAVELITKRRNKHQAMADDMAVYLQNLMEAKR